MREMYKKIIGHHVLANLVLIAVLVVGAMAVLNMSRQSNPDVFIPGFNITMAHPGANPEEIEEGITQKIEASVDSLRGVKSYISISSEGSARVEVEVSDGHDVDVVRERIRNALDTIDSFPDDADPYQIDQMINSETVTNVVISGDIPYRQLKEFTEHVRDELQNIPLVSLVEVFNSREYEIAVNVPREKLELYDLTLGDISDSIRRSSINFSAGTLKLDREEIRLRTLEKRYNGTELESIVVTSTPEGERITLGQISHINDGFSEDEHYFYFNGKPGLMLEVEQSTGEDTIRCAEAVRAYVEEKQKTLPPNVQMTVGFDQTSLIRSQLNLISRNGLLGLVLVVIVLGLFLEPRLAFWVAMGIPISLAGAMILLWLYGATLNQISLVALIIVMGIIVDDAIVAGEAIYVHRRMGKAPLDAAVDGIREVGMPIFASVMTTIAAFGPMLFMSGVFGQFTMQMPMVVIAALAVSLFECMVLLPAHLIYHNQAHKEKATRQYGLVGNTLTLFKALGIALVRPLNFVRVKISSGLENFVEKVYDPFIRVAVHYRYITLCACFALLIFTAGLMAGGFVKVVMWPATEGDIIDASVEFPPGTPIKTVRNAVIHIEESLDALNEKYASNSGDPIVKQVFTFVPYRSDASGAVQIELTPSSNREIPSSVLQKAWSDEVGIIPGATTQGFSGMTIGAGGEYDIEFWLQGPDLQELRNAAGLLKEKLGHYSGVYQIADNFKPGKSELHIELKPMAEALGLTSESISRQIYGRFYGEESVHLQRGPEDVEVRVRLPLEERASIHDFEATRILTPEGNHVPLASVAAYSWHEGLTQISGRNGLRGVRVTAVVDRAATNAAEVNKDIEETFMPGLLADHPGVSSSIAGSEQQNRVMIQELQRNSLISMLIIFTILATIFRSYLQPAIIMVIIPFGLMGAIYAHILIGLPISFLSFFGIMALLGVLVNDSIVLIERINVNIAEGMPLKEAVTLGGKRRFRAIFLTSLSTCAGLAPMIVETDFMAQIVIPMAVALAGGVTVGTLLTLVIVPAVLVVINDFRRAYHKLMNGNWPTPEEVEPAYKRMQPHDSGLDSAQPEGLMAK
jgi:multidrug efflux pump subunit AcrB